MNPLKTKMKFKRTLILAILAIFVISVTGTASAISKKSLTRTDKNGPVTVIVTYLNPIKKMDGSSINFEMKLDTHSVDLDQYKLEELSFIKFDDGAEFKSSGLSTEGSGHHITYVLHFPGPIP